MEKQQMAGMPCTIQRINEITDGWKKGELIAVGSATGMGKTAFLKSCVNGCIDDGNKVGVISLEMANYWFMNRLVSQDVGKSTRDLMVDGQMGNSDSKEGASLNKYIKWMMFQPTHDSSIRGIVNDIRRMVQDGSRLIIIDSYNLINKQEGVDPIFIFKNLAIELSVPIVITFQMSLRGASDIEKLRYNPYTVKSEILCGCDTIIFLYRPEADHRGIHSHAAIEFNGNPIEIKGFAEAIIYKCRNGNGDGIAVPMKFNAQLTKFEDYK